MWTAETCQFGDSGEANNLRLGSLRFAYVRLIGKNCCGRCARPPRLEPVWKLRGALFSWKRPDGATKENIPGGSSTEEQRSQAAFSAKTLRAAGLLSVAGVGSVLTARCVALRAAKAALATAEIPRRRAPRSFQTGS